jgi:type IV secretory pathway VirB10-like protein
MSSDDMAPKKQSFESVQEAASAASKDEKPIQASEQPVSSAANETASKQSAEELGLTDAPIASGKLNRKNLKMIMTIFVIGFLAVFMMAIYQREREVKIAEQEEEMGAIMGTQIPSLLIPSGDDYAWGYGSGGEDDASGSGFQGDGGYSDFGSVYSGPAQATASEIPANVRYLYDSNGNVYDRITGELVPVNVTPDGKLVDPNGNEITPEMLAPRDDTRYTVDYSTSTVDRRTTTPTPPSPPEARVRTSPFSSEGASSGGSGVLVTSSEPTPEELMLESARNGSMRFGVSINSASGSSEVDPALELARLQNEGALVTDAMRQNMQQQKIDFIMSRRQDFSNYLDGYMSEAIAPANELKAGTTIAIILEVGVNTDLPGQVVGRVQYNVYDSLTGTNILIPKASTAIGTYDSNVSFGQNRAIVVWDRIIRPDGASLNLQGMMGTDASGMSGMTGSVDTHLDEIYGVVAMATGFDYASAGVVSALSSIPELRSLSTVIGESDSVSAAENVVNAYTNKMIDRQPTITIPAGTPGYIFVNKDMIIEPYEY